MRECTNANGLEFHDMRAHQEAKDQLLLLGLGLSTICAFFLGTSTAWMLGKTPPEAMVMPGSADKQVKARRYQTDNRDIKPLLELQG